jgi:hypothetical protein
MSARRAPAGSRPAPARAVPPAGTTQRDVDHSLGLSTVRSRLPMQLIVAGLVAGASFLIALISAAH